MTNTPEPYPLQDYERAEFVREHRACVNVQWKGIPICADIACDCGASSHLDDVYYGRWTCHNCGRTFQLAWTATAYEVEPNGYEPTTEESR